MATYASNTNPFLNSENTPTDRLDRFNKKDAPGMARLQSCVDEEKKQDESSPSLSKNDDDGTQTSSEPSTDNLSIAEQQDNEDEPDIDNELPPMEKDDRRHQHIELIRKLRLQLRDLERYAYERGELDLVPPSVLAERQTVIIDTLKEKLSLNICLDEIEKLGLDELKKQVDKQVHDLIDPMITKEHLLSQLKTQLTDLERYIAQLRLSNRKSHDGESCSCQLHGCLSNSGEMPTPPESSDGQVKYNDDAAWSLHIDRIVLAVDSLVNLFTLEPQYRRTSDKSIDENLVESVVRRQLVPAIKDLLSYGLIDPSSIPRPNSYISLLLDPYYLLSSFTCFPTSQKASNGRYLMGDKPHVWDVINDYFCSRNEPEFKTSSVKTLSQSFNLEPSISGPIKITSKQALLIAVDDIIETLSKCKPNGPESHFRAFIYTALNRSKLSTWLRLVFKNKSTTRKYYHNFSFVSQPDKMDKFLRIIEGLHQIEFNLNVL